MSVWFCTHYSVHERGGGGGGGGTSILILLSLPLLGADLVQLQFSEKICHVYAVCKGFNDGLATAPMTCLVFVLSLICL